ncbi:hypothetical protein FACS189487_10120 [Campylobacterota bacterium]|nr:hypothetical protein FACS189487_10120 [Campylobacterota bacterium]
MSKIIIFNYDQGNRISSTDQDGRLKTKRNTQTNETATYNYGTLGELLSIELPDKTITYTHNANNQRIANAIDALRGWW